jgi:hypothetical protein
LLEVVLALGAGSGLTDSLYCGQEQPDQVPDDRDDHEEFDERETASFVSMHG